MFDVIYAMTSGGPVRATTVLSLATYRRAFENWDIGMACAIGLFWFVTIAPIALFYLRLIFKDGA